MLLFILEILVAGGLVTLFNVFFMPAHFSVGVGFTIAAVWISVLGEVALDGVISTIIRRALPQKWFAHDKKIFTVSAKEKKFYEKLKIRKWKDKVPELGMFTNFSKNRIADPHSPEYLERYFLEACFGEVIHFVLPFLGFLALAFFPRYWYCIGLPVAIFNILMNVPSLFILRYNSYKLEILYKNVLRRNKRAKERQLTENVGISSDGADASF